MNAIEACLPALTILTVSMLLELINVIAKLVLLKMEY